LALHWHCTDPHADLEEVFQHPSISGDTFSGTFGSPNADSQPTPDSSPHPGDQKSGQQIKRVYSNSYQHLMKKLPKERERYWNNIQSAISDKF